MLLELYRAELEQRRVSLSGIGYAASVSQATAGRALHKLERHGLIRPNDDPSDGRRTWVVLTKKGLSALREVLENARQRPV